MNQKSRKRIKGEKFSQTEKQINEVFRVRAKHIQRLTPPNRIPKNHHYSINVKY